jgi:DNA repair protein RecN (Recombination protein N)
LGAKLINRFYLEEYLSFKSIDLEFNNGLVIFTGASGAGKSILMGAILSLLGNSDAKARLSEISCDGLNICNEAYNIKHNEEFV